MDALRQESRAWSCWLTTPGSAAPPQDWWRDPAGLRRRFLAMAPQDLRRLLRGTFIPVLRVRSPDPTRDVPLLAIATALWDVLPAHDEETVRATMACGRTWPAGLGAAVVAPADLGLFWHLLDGLELHPGLVRYALLRSWLHHAGPQLAAGLELSLWPTRPAAGVLLGDEGSDPSTGGFSLTLAGGESLKLQQTSWGWKIVQPPRPAMALGAPGRFRTIADFADRAMDLARWPLAAGRTLALPPRLQRHPQTRHVLPWLARACAPAGCWRPRTSAMDEALDGAGFRRPEWPVNNREPQVVTPIHRRILRQGRHLERLAPFSRRAHAFWQALETIHPGIRRHLATPADRFLDDPRFWTPEGLVDDAILDPRVALVVGGLLLRPEAGAVERLLGHGWVAACAPDGQTEHAAVESTLTMAAQRPWPASGCGSWLPHDLARTSLPRPRTGIALAIVFGLLAFEDGYGRHPLHGRILDLPDPAVSTWLQRLAGSAAIADSSDIPSAFVSMLEDASPRDLAEMDEFIAQASVPGHSSDGGSFPCHD